MDTDERRESEQKLIDICFQIAELIHREKVLQELTRDEIMAWTAQQLEMCGYSTVPTGMSWGILK